MMEALRQWKADCQVAATITEGGELLEYDREQGALLDARIERKIQSCFRLKAMEHRQTYRCYWQRIFLIQCFNPLREIVLFLAAIFCPAASRIADQPNAGRSKHVWPRKRPCD